ncbi:MAG: 3-oxoacid CoA-transferase, partial [Nitrospinota bacterium]
MEAEQAVALVKSGATLCISGSGGGHAVPELLIKTLAERFRRTGEPRDLTLVHAVGIGDWDKQGVSHLAQEGLLKRSITSNYGNGPLVGRLALEEKIEAYSFPQGVLSQLYREISAHRPGLVTHVGLGTFVDPRYGGGKVNRRTQEDLVELVTLGGKEWLFYKAFPIDVAFIRGTTADEAGNITMEQEAFFGEVFSIAAAAHNSGGIVIAQVKQLAKRGTLPAKQVKVPGVLVDAIVLDPHQLQTYLTSYSPGYAGEIKQPVTTLPRLPLDARKIIARRASLELFPGAIVNLGFGIANGIALV